MARDELSYWDYVKKAFLARPEIKGLGEVPVNALALLGVGVMGLAFGPGVWLIGAGLEIGYLALVSHDPRFRKWADAVHRAARSGDSEARKRAVLQGLSEQRRLRYETLEEGCARMLEGSRASLAAAAPVDKTLVDGVNRLLWIFLKLLVSSQVLDSSLSQSSRDKLVKEIAAYERQHEDAVQNGREKVAQSLAGTLDIARKRLENLDQAYEQGQFIQAELHRIEQQVALMIQEATLSRESGFLTQKVDSVMETFNQTQDWMKANADLLGPMEEDFEAPPPIFQTES